MALNPEGFETTSQTGPRLQLHFPLLLDKAQNSTKPSNAVVRGNNVEVEYPQGVKLAVERKGSAITLHFTGLTDTSSGFRMEMTLPGEFKDGGTWKIAGQDAKAFPTQFAKEQFVFKGEPKPVTFSSIGGGTVMTIAMPYGWHQVQDARAWNSPNFDYMFTTSMPRGDGNEATFNFKLWAGDQDHESGQNAEAPQKQPATAGAQPDRPATFGLTQDGLLIEAGSMGAFTMDYPALVGARWDDVHKAIERKVTSDTATIKYEGDAHVDITWHPADHTLTLKPVALPDATKAIRLAMLIDFSIASGGDWQFGASPVKPFPAQKPRQPHLFQGNIDSLTIRNAEGASFNLQLPPNSFQQLTDNREWGWKMFAWQCDIPRLEGDAAITVKLSVAGAAAGVKLCDAFGQSTRAQFPSKVKAEAELQQDVQQEASWLAELRPPVTDDFGGLPGSGLKLGLNRTGFFHVEKKSEQNGRWILVDPQGNAYFHLGICGFTPSDDYTFVAGRERIYEWLPPHEGAFASAYHPDSYWNPLAFSFHLANVIRKTGQPYDSASYTTRMIERARKWGFNAAGAFGAGDAETRRKASFPHVSTLPLATWEGFPEIPGAHGAFDPFSDALIKQCEKNFSQALPPSAADPLLIGYFLNNEPLYENIPGAVAALDGSYPCKQRLVAMLKEHYKTIEAFNAAWQTMFRDFSDVATSGLPLKTDAAKADMQSYTALFLETYFKLVNETFHKYDKNHMLIGNRLQPGTIESEALCRLSGKYLDLVSFNYYTYGLDRTKLERVHGWMGDKPMFFSEFYFDSPAESGLAGGGKDVDTQRERGLAYRQYVEQAAALGYVVGIEWFTLVDQATTGRYFEKYTGEAANTGLISVTDRPYKPMIEEMIKTNYDIYQVWLGEKPPFVFDDSRFSPAR